MSLEPNYLDVKIMGREYRVACGPEERDALLAAVDLVNGDSGFAMSALMYLVGGYALARLSADGTPLHSVEQVEVGAHLHVVGHGADLDVLQARHQQVGVGAHVVEFIYAAAKRE